MTRSNVCTPIVTKIAGGWLARTPANHHLRYGARGHTEDEARHQFELTSALWHELDERTQADQSHDAR